MSCDFEFSDINPHVVTMPIFSAYSQADAIAFRAGARSFFASSGHHYLTQSTKVDDWHKCSGLRCCSKRVGFTPLKPRFRNIFDPGGFSCADGEPSQITSPDPKSPQQLALSVVHARRGVLKNRDTHHRPFRATSYAENTLCLSQKTETPSPGYDPRCLLQAVSGFRTKPSKW